MDAQDALAALEVRKVDDHAAVEAPRTEECRIENVRTVRGCHEDHTVVRLEAVHLHEELVQGLLAFIMAAAQAGATVPSDGVDLIDEDDARGVLLALLEEVAN